ncbi:MAG: YraN family protein [Pontibacterium sp.]
MDRNQLGKDAEQHALQFLITKGLSPLTQNYRCRTGEIDLIMKENSTLVFVEVRLRQNRLYGSAADSVTSRKQQKIIRAARYFLSGQPALQNLECRFDVIAYDGTEALAAPLWYKDAFRL